VGKKEKKINVRERERERAPARKYFLRISINLICLSTHNLGLKEANFTMKLLFFNQWRQENT
jgi:hypothetical protein